MRCSLSVFGTVALASAGLVPAWGQASVVPAAEAAATPVRAKAPAEGEMSLPLRAVALYKNGVGFFERAGQVSGNELVRIDLTTAQLNDVLQQSLTAVDLGGGTISGGGYDNAVPLAMQLNALVPGLGPDPTVLDFLHAMKGTRVEVHMPSAVVAGRLMNMEVRREPEGKGSAVPVERRYVSLMTDAGGLRTFELTPSVEVRLVGGQRQEIGRYLQLLETSHTTPVRHLTLEDRGTGTRELHVSYLTAMPAWKTSYRILFTNGAPGTALAPPTATLQGWAVVDNTSGADWKDVQLTLVSGAPQSFIQQISRPLVVPRQELPMPGARTGQPMKRPPVFMGAMADPIGAAEAASMPIDASSMGGGGGVEVQRAVVAAPAPQQAKAVSADGYEAAAERTLAPDATPIAMDGLFEYKLSKPMSIRKDESATVPILQTELAAERVTVWNPREHPGAPMRALWLTNTSSLTLDAGSFSIIESGVFGGQGQMELMHPKERRIVGYGVDNAVKVDFAESKKPPAPYVQRLVVEDGKLKVHVRTLKQRDYTIHNSAASARTVVLETVRTDRFRSSPDRPYFPAVWALSVMTPAATEATGTMYRFEVAVEANGTSTFKLIETHSHPTTYDIATMREDELQAILKQIDSPDGVARVKPFLDAKQKLAELDKKLKAEKRAMDEATAEERRIREYIDSLKGSAEERALARRYADEINQEEDRIAALRAEKAALETQRDTVQTDLAKLAVVPVDMTLPRPAWITANN
jgi:hypothetical protein